MEGGKVRTQASPGDPVIALKNLTKSYGSFKAVDDLSLTVNRGEIFGLLGPNGAGKTTTILMMIGMTDPDEGSATVCGYNATREPFEVKKRVGYMPDTVGFYDNMTAFENLVYIGRLNGIADDGLEARVAKVLEIVGLADQRDKKTGAFSRGMKQRLGLADVLIKKPEVIVLDEPTLGIDPSGVKDFLALIKRLSREEGLTVLLSSHHLHHVQQVCDRVGIFVSGKLLATGDVETLSRQLFGARDHAIAIELEQDLPTDWEYSTQIMKWDEIDHLSIVGNVIEFSCTRDLTPQLVRFLVKHGLDITNITKKKHGLDDIYQKYFENPEPRSQRLEKQA